MSFTDSVDESSTTRRKTKSKKNQNKPIDLTIIQNDRLREAFEDFIEHRKQIKRPMSQLALSKTYLELETMAATVDEQIRILNHSIANGWQGIFPLKHAVGGQKGGSSNANIDIGSFRFKAEDIFPD